jgi:diaminohydroxyphosphoribosylaminopyrimidine deaminase / 5-amino-6-(5-phosphoribosylamino)uracil reductase
MMNQRKHVDFMYRCIELAKNGRGNVDPNPMVGCVIVHDGKIIGEGFHKFYGEAHAEVNAIESVKDKLLLRESTLYVNLEPCSHFGKTPPCSHLIVKSNIPKVVIGSIDSNVEVAGKGISYLEKNGVEVISGVKEEECIELNRRFFTFHEKKRPYIILKWAQSLDGFIDEERENNEQKGAWLTNETCRALVHKWRAEEPSILIGKRTAILDNPALNIRLWTGNNPVRIVIDKEADLPENLTIFDQSILTICYTSKKKISKRNLEFVEINFDTEIIPQILKDLYKRNIQSIIVEGGALTLAYFHNLNLWDEARLFIGSRILKNGVEGLKIEGEIISRNLIGDSELICIRNY